VDQREKFGQGKLKTDSHLLSDLANKPDNVGAHDITTSTQKLVNRLRGAGRRGRKRKNKTKGPKRKYKKAKIGAPVKRDFFPNSYLSRHIPVGERVATTWLPLLMKQKWPLLMQFDIFEPKLLHASVQKNVDVTYIPIATIDGSDPEFTIPADSDSYVDPDIHIFVSGQLLSVDGKALDSTDHTSVSNNLLHSLFSHCSVTLNVTPITQSTQNYGYRAM
jgi:hypothetical protein